MVLEEDFKLALDYLGRAVGTVPVLLTQKEKSKLFLVLIWLSTTSEESWEQFCCFNSKARNQDCFDFYLAFDNFRGDRKQFGSLNK